jgi:hypothetical protein
MSLSSRGPGIMPGWQMNGKRGTQRLHKSAKHFQKRREHRYWKAELREELLKKQP